MEDWRKRFKNLVMAEGTKDGRIPPITMGELLIQSQKPNIKPLEDFIEQEIEKARKDIYSEFLEYKKSYIENIWKSGIPDDLIEDTLNNVDDYLKSKLTTK